MGARASPTLPTWLHLVDVLILEHTGAGMLLALGSQSHNETVITETQGNKDDSISSSRQLPVITSFHPVISTGEGQRGSKKGWPSPAPS